jgi:hypothetical protein
MPMQQLLVVDYSRSLKPTVAEYLDGDTRTAYVLASDVGSI